MLEGDKSISIRFLISISPSWEKNFWRITTIICLLLQHCDLILSLDSMILRSAEHSQKVRGNRHIYTSILVQRKSEPWKSIFWLSPPIGFSSHHGTALEIVKWIPLGWNEIKICASLMSFTPCLKQNPWSTFSMDVGLSAMCFVPESYSFWIIVLVIVGPNGVSLFSPNFRCLPYIFDPGTCNH